MCRWDVSTSYCCLGTLIFQFPTIFGTRGRSLHDTLATGSNRFRIYRELEDQGLRNKKISNQLFSSISPESKLMGFAPKICGINHEGYPNRTKTPYFLRGHQSTQDTTMGSRWNFAGMQKGPLNKKNSDFYGSTKEPTIESKTNIYDDLTRIESLRNTLPEN